MSIEPLKANPITDEKLDETAIISGTTKKMKENEEAPNLRATMKDVIQFLKSNASIVIDTPFQGTNLQITKDQKRVVFSSRGSSSQAARLAVVDLKSEEVEKDEGVSNCSIWTLALSQNDEFVFAGGEDRIITKYSLSELKRIQTFEGHQGDVNKICVNSDDSWMFTASDDGSIRLWTLRDPVPKCVVLFTSRGKFFGLDLSRDDHLLCAGGDEGVVYIYEVGQSFNNPGCLIKTFSHGDEIWSMKISPQSNFFAFGDSSGKLKVYSFNNWTPLPGVEASNRISDIDISLDESVIVGASKDKTVKVFYRNLGKEFSFTGHEKWVKRAAFIDKSTRVVSIGDDKKLKIWKVPQPDTEQVFYEEKNFNVRKIWISPRSGLLEAVCDKWKFETSQNEHQCVDNCSEHRETFYVTWDKSGKKSELMKISSQWLTFAHVNKECTEILYAHRASQQIISEFNGDWDIKNTYVCVIDTQNKTKSRSNLIPGDISSFGYSNSGKFLIIGEWFKFTLIRYENLEIVQSIYAMPGEVLATVMDNEDSLLFAANHNTLKKFKYQPNEQELIADIDRKSYDIDYLSQDFRINLTFSEDWQYLFCIFERFLEIVHCDTFTTLLRIDQSYNGILFNLNHTLFMYGNGITDIYSARSFQKMSNLGKSFSVLDGILSSTKKNMYLVAKDCIYKSENPLSASQLTFVGNYTFLPEFQNHVDKIFNKKCDEPYLDSLWLIEPVHINLLHIYSYFNLSEMLRLGITGNEYLKIPIINSRDGFSALTIAIEKKYHDSIEAIIKTIRRLVKQDTSFMRQILFQVIEESLIDLTSMSYLSLHKLLNDIYIYDTSGYLLNYCPPGIKVPVLSLSDNFFAEDVEFGYKMNEDTELGSSVVFKKSLMKFYMKVGSSKSLEFMNTLADCENPDIYDTPVIKEILQQKWSQVKWFMYGQSSLYITYLILLCLFTSFESCRSGTFLIAPFAISGILYLYELIFVFLGPLTYFTDFWNLIDTLRSILMISYSALIWSGYFEISFEKKEKERYMLAVLIFISWTRGITYFRINAATRYLIKLLFQVVLDIVPFMVILFYSAVAFGLIFRAFDSGSNSDFFPYLTESYNIIIGGWDNPTDPEFYSLILLLATLLNPVISLNLLVAILSDTFETVSRDQIVADSQEMAEMIVEIETLIFCNRKKNEKKFLHVMENDSADVEEELELNVLVKNVRSKVNYLNVELKDHHSALDRLEQRVNETTNGVRNTFNSFMNR